MSSIKRLGVGAALLALVLALSGDVSIGQDDACTVTVQPGDSIQQAIDAFGWGPDPVVCLAGGTWEENLRVKRNLTLRGQGPDQSTIKGTKPGHPVIWIESSDAIDVTLRGLSVTDAQGMDGQREKCADDSDENRICPYGVQIMGKASVKAENLKVSENGRYGLGIGNSASLEVFDSIISDNLGGLAASDSATVSAQNSTISGSDDWPGVAVFDSADLELSNSQVSGNEHGGVYAQSESELALRDNRFLNNRRCGIAVWSTGVTVEGTPNEMRGNRADLCAHTPASVRKPLTPETDQADLSVPDDYDTLQKAVDAIAPGGTISVGEGGFEVNATIWKPVTLQGQGQTQTTLRTSNLALSVIAEAAPVELQNVKIQTTQPEDGWADSLWLYGTTTLADMEMSGGNWAVSAGLDAQIDLRNVEITKSTSRAIGAWGSANVNVSNSTLADNEHDGIVAVDSSQVDVANCQIRGSADDGLVAGESSQMTVEDSEISGSGDQGAVIERKAEATVTASTFTENAENGVVIDDNSQATLTDITSSANGNDGAVIKGDAQAELSKSRIVENEDDGIALAGSITADIADNTIADNADCGIVLGRDDINSDIEVAGSGNEISNNDPNVCDPTNKLPPGFEVDLD